MANPAFNNSPAFSGKSIAQLPMATAAAQKGLSTEQLDELYGRPSATPAETDRMSYEDTIVKIVVSFAILLGGAVIGWFVPVLWIPAAIVGFVLALVNIFKKQPSPALILSYAAVEGVFVGGISNFYSQFGDGIVPQAVFGTLAIVGITLALFLSGKVRSSKRATKVFMIAMIGYLAFSLVNVVLMLTGVTTGMFGLRSIEFLGLPLGVWLGALIVLMAAYSLVIDFEQIKTGVERGAPRIFGWTAAFGIMVTVVWLYTEVLRIVAMLTIPRN